MKLPMALAGLLLLVAAVPPTGSAEPWVCSPEPAAHSCVGEYANHARCTDGPGHEANFTGAQLGGAGAGARVGGYEECTRYCSGSSCITYRNRGVTAGAWALGQGAVAWWFTDTHDRCYVFAIVATPAGTKYGTFGCLGQEPPNLAWGNLIP